MKIVASTKLTKAQRAMESSRAYGQTSNTVFKEAETKPLEGENKKVLLIVCSSDKGLCGGIHSGLSRAVRRMLDNDPAEYNLVCVGEKSKAQLGRSNAKDMAMSFAGVGKDVPTFADAQAIADQVTLLPGDYSSIKIIYNKFINATSYEPTVVEAFSEEAIKESRELAPHHTVCPLLIYFAPQQTSLTLRLTTPSLETCASMLLPTRSIGRLPKAMPARSPLVAMPWTMHPRTPAK
jgi:F-type H+-transporting ATPase subunit gamma